MRNVRPARRLPDGLTFLLEIAWALARRVTLAALGLLAAWLVLGGMMSL